MKFKLILTCAATLLLNVCTVPGAEARTVDTAGVAAEIGFMLNAKHAVTSLDERRQLASEILKQVENPLSINQGHHNTCAFAATEARTYTLYPRAAAELIRQVATTGMYTTARGEKIKIDVANLKPDVEATTGGYGSRSYASQLFQITAANIYWQRQSADPRGIECRVGTIRYIQQQPSLVIPNDTGERLQILWKDGTVETVVSDAGRPICEPCVSLDQVQEVGTLVAQQPNDKFVIAGRKFDRTQKYIGVKSMEDLRHQLLRCRQDNRLPLIAAVDTSHGLFDEPIDSNSSRLHEAKPSWHAVCITDYDPQHDRVSIDNFWGQRADRVGENSISISELYSVITSTN